MIKRIAEASPRPRARLTGAVYLLYFLTAVFATLLVEPRLVVYSDAANVFSIACYIAVTLLFYYMFKPVNRSLSLFAAVLGLMGCAITALDLFDRNPSQMSPLLFFGPFCILIGYLIFRSTFLPRTLGVLMSFAGLGWLIFLSPLLANHLSSYLKALGILAEGSLMLWLLAFGVNVQRWNQQASAARGDFDSSTPMHS
ncbi:MAG: DUF4386 domain-containing protein [Candidatus Eremiobacteraeota bacterium]|nr:DUF4386 domain-containing protein [Candidatus Eremiobacteraeota bacterium]